MNHYEQKQQARKERLEAAADKAREESDRLMKRGSEMASVIPLGQPILVGHHSEGRDRNYRKRIGATFDKAIEANKRAEYLEEKAASVGTGGISSDDPDALDKLKEKLTKEIERHELNKKINAAIRKGKTYVGIIANLTALGLSSSLIAELTKNQPGYGMGIPSFELTNANARIASIKKRIEQLEKKAKLVTREFKFGEITYREDTDLNRITLEFPGKPAPEVIKNLKSNAFRWSPTNGVWQNYLTGRGQYQAKNVLIALGHEVEFY